MLEHSIAEIAELVRTFGVLELFQHLPSLQVPRAFNAVVTVGFGIKPKTERRSCYVPQNRCNGLLHITPTAHIKLQPTPPPER